MRLDAALTEIAYAKDWSPAARHWYAVRLGAFVAYAKQAGVDEVGDLTAPLVRRWIDEIRTTPTAAGTRRDSHTVHGYARAVRAFLNWAAREGLLDERVPQRISLPKKEQKVLQVLSDSQLARLFDQAAGPRPRCAIRRC